MRSRKYLFYMPALIGGGAERVWALLASAFARRGHDVTFVVDYDSDENEAFIDPLVKRVTLPSGHFCATLGLARLLWREHPDVSLSGLGVANLKHMIAALMVLRHRRAVLSFHGFFASEPQFLSRLGNRLTPLLTRLCGRAVTVSDGLRQALIGEHHASAARLVRIYNPVYRGSRDTVRPDRAMLAARTPIALFVGRLNVDKDIPTLLRAFAATKIPDARLEIVGDGPLRSELEALAESLGLAGRVRFRGYLPDPAVAYREARCLVLPSRRESFGNVVAEALDQGLAVVTTATDGPSEILEHGRFGAIVPIGDVAAMAAAMAAALADPGDPEPRIAHAASFAIETATDAYLAMTEAVIAQAS
jgi:glycosyltransferase involved in cell wall biosynthesis